MIDFNYTKPAEVFLTRETVAECTDTASLQSWAEQLDVLEEEVMANISAFTDCRQVPHPGAVRKLSYTRVVKSWVARRRRELSGQSTDVVVNQRSELARLNDLVQDLKEQLAEAQARQDVRVLALVVEAAGGRVHVSERVAENANALVLTRADVPSGGFVFTTEVSCG